MDANLVMLFREDIGDHLRMKRRRDGGDEERSRNLVLVQESQDPR